MSDKNADIESIFDSVFSPSNKHSHIAYAVNSDNDSKKIILTRIGTALENRQGDLKITINSKHAAENIFLFKKD